ncbi:hypothetical protein [Streptacidiphilus rugosus]|uniref:hypothetical protein n=1 Tax=Streptacidiphilus rugosus TaxID=405783 RepID=UPI00056ADA6B|nr:hypothetical protein [Streptacidiphilus rugosus]
MTAPELTCRILTALLRRQAAGTDQLLALLREENPTNQGLLDGRLRALHEQQLVARIDGVWLLTDDGLAVARSNPVAGLAIETPLTAPAAAGNGGRADAVTSLALSFLQAHRAAFGDAPFEWEPRPRLRSRDSAGGCREVRPTAAMKTLIHRRHVLEPVHALVDLWADQHEPEAAVARLRLYAELTASEGDHPAKGPWRRWFGRAPLLLIALPSDSAIGAVGHAFREAARADLRVQGLFDNMSIGVVSVDAVTQAGADAAVWWSPVDGREQVWQELRCGKERAQRASCATSVCHPTR